jgi:hypothetical protein
MRFQPQSKSGPGSYRLGQFHIQKVKSRWRVIGSPRRTFSTLGGAVAWCQHQLRSGSAEVRQSIKTEGFAPEDRCARQSIEQTRSSRTA